MSLAANAGRPPLLSLSAQGSGAQTEPFSHVNHTLCPRVDYPAVAFVLVPSRAPRGRPHPPPQTQRSLAHAAQG